MKVQNLKSDELNKVPDSSLLKYGEIAVNYAADGEKLIIKNSRDEIVTFDRIDKDDYYTKEEIDGDYYTKEAIDNKLKNINTSGGTGGTVDLSEYAKRTWVEEQDNAIKTWVEGHNYLTEHQDISGLATKEEVSNDLTNLKSEILGGAGEDYDTLKEIEAWINTHEDVYKGLIAELGTKATKEELKEKADQKYVEGEVETLTEELNKKSNVVVCDNQYEFDQILTKDNNTIYLIKGDQDQWFSKDDGDELYDFYGGLLERVRELERLHSIVDYDNEETEEEN